MTATIKTIIGVVVIIIAIFVVYWFVSPKQTALVVPNHTDPSVGSVPEVTPLSTVPSIENSPIKINTYPNRTTAELNSAIIKAAPGSLKDAKGQINFVFVSSISPEQGWYIVTLRASTSGTSDTKRVILKDNGSTAGGLVFVAGPSSNFPDTINLPVQVRIALS